MQRILVIDDEEQICDSMCRVLEREGYDAIAAADGRIGLDVARRGEFDLIISDVIMPGIDGIELIKSIRQSYPSVPIIAISGGGNLALGGYQPDALKTAAYMAAAVEAGANACLTKPFERAELLQEVQRLLQ